MKTCMLSYTTLELTCPIFVGAKKFSNKSYKEI
jgi:hypothetical protein